VNFVKIETQPLYESLISGRVDWNAASKDRVHEDLPHHPKGCIGETASDPCLAWKRRLASEISQKFSIIQMLALLVAWSIAR
jgi:hypothetical protein